MGTQFKGDKPKNNVTIFTGNGDTAPANVDPATGRRTVTPGVSPVEPEAAPAPEAKEAEASEVPARSFAQPSPVAPPVNPTPKAHASEEEKAEALRKNSTMRQGDGNDEDAETDADTAS